MSRVEVTDAGVWAALRDRARALVRAGRPAVLGVVGPPGAGKSTLAARLVADLAGDAVLVPMDGFHLADAVLDVLGLRDRKGAPETFDAWGYVRLLERIQSGPEPVVYAPDFDRSLEAAVAGVLPVPRDVPLVVTEGNYLLLDAEPWGRIRGLLDEAWYADVGEELRLARLVARHEAFGKSPDAALAWSLGPDQRNADVVRATSGRADLRVMLDGWRLPRP